MRVRAAVVQAAPAAFDRARTLDKLDRLVAEAARAGAEIAVFPEAFVSGYPKGLDFGAVVGRRTREGRDQFRRYLEAAVEVVWGFGDGSTLPVLDTRLGRVGAVICWENYMPLLRMAMYSKGVQLYCAPTADDRETWLPTMRHIALEGRCFVLSACQVLRRSDMPADIPNALGDAPQTLLMRGGSCIIDPAGKVLAGPAFEEEAILSAELDLDEIARGKYDLDVVGHYARPDVFQLSVNERPLKPVVPER